MLLSAGNTKGFTLTYTPTGGDDECSNGATNWPECNTGCSPSPCPPIMTGDLIPESPFCVISLGQSNCIIEFGWTTTNPVVTSSVTRDGGGTVGTGNSGSNVPFTIPYNSATFRLMNNGIQLDISNVSSSCVTGSTWNGSSCVLAPPEECENGATNYPDCDCENGANNPPACTTFGPKKPIFIED